MRLRLVVLSGVLSLVAGFAGAQPVNFPSFCTTTGLTLNGSAAALNPNAGCVLRLTNNLGQSSSVFLTNAISLAADASFSSFFRFQLTNSIGIGDSDGPGADGIVFAVQTVSNTAGGGGGGIGFQGISPSVGAEFDTFNNGAQDQNDPNHVGIDINGNMTSVALVHVTPRFNDGNVWFAWVDYNGATKSLEVRVNQTGIRPAAPTLQSTQDLPAILGTNNAFVGFTSGTGAGGNTQDILSWQFIPSFAPIDGNPTETVPTLSFPMMALLALAIGAAGFLLLKAR